MVLGVNYGRIILTTCLSLLLSFFPPGPTAKFDRDRMLKELNSAGFDGRYDFFYLPTDFQCGRNILEGAQIILINWNNFFS